MRNLRLFACLVVGHRINGYRHAYIDRGDMDIEPWTFVRCARCSLLQWVVPL